MQIAMIRNMQRGFLSLAMREEYDHTPTSDIFSVALLYQSRLLFIVPKD